MPWMSTEESRLSGRDLISKVDEYCIKVDEYRINFSRSFSLDNPK
jgi:hypothetical protein